MRNVPIPAPQALLTAALTTTAVALLACGEADPNAQTCDKLGGELVRYNNCSVSFRGVKVPVELYQGEISLPDDREDCKGRNYEHERQVYAAAIQQCVEIADAKTASLLKDDRIESLEAQVDRPACGSDVDEVRRTIKTLRRLDPGNEAARRSLAELRTLKAQRAKLRALRKQSIPERKLAFDAPIVQKCVGIHDPQYVYGDIAPPKPSDSGDVDCSDFSDQQDAQDYLEAKGNNADLLDGDGNGDACESLP